MNTPIHDFVKAYASSAPVRLHMPGHKGRGPLGCEELDITEIPGADSLYEASGVIAESEANASRLFGCPTYYSTEGSSHCIRAMLLLAKQLQTVGGGVPDAPRVSARDAAADNRQQATGNRQQAAGEDPVGGGVLRSEASPLGDAPQLLGSDTFGASRTPPPTEIGRRFRVLAARNVHRAFLSAAALLDLDVVWLPQAGGSYLSAAVTPEALDAALAESGARAVYLSCPDYLGFLPELRPLAAICHARGALLLVDNAHGAYLRFLPESRHPMDLGADLCCDSAHKTLPVLTGGAYLHVSERLAALSPQAVRDALALFGSSSPSYLILQSLDLANPYLEALPETLAAFLPRVEALKTRLRAAGWRLAGDEPLKLTLALSPAGTAKTSPACRGGGPASRPVEGCRPSTAAAPGLALAAALERAGVFCEFADPDFVVFMLSPQNTAEELARLEAALSAAGLEARNAPVIASGNDAAAARRQEASGNASLRTERTAECRPYKACEVVCTLREALLSPCETLPAAESPGRVLARPGVSCPPAVPIRMPGERIDEAAAAAFARYGIRSVAVLPRKTENTDS